MMATSAATRQLAADLFADTHTLLHDAVRSRVQTLLQQQQ
jgi:hypothetical protein